MQRRAENAAKAYAALQELDAQAHVLGGVLRRRGLRARLLATPCRQDRPQPGQG